MKHRYLHLFSAACNHRLVAVFDVSSRQWERNFFGIGLQSTIMADISYFQVTHGYLAPAADLANWRPERNRDGEIVLAQRPVRLELEQLVELLSVKPRKSMTASQLANLVQGGLTDENRNRNGRPVIFSPAKLEQASAMRLARMGWQEIAAELGVRVESLKAAMRRQKRAAYSHLMAEATPAQFRV